MKWDRMQMISWNVLILYHLFISVFPHSGSLCLWEKHLSVQCALTYASVNSSCAHAPPPPRANPRALAFFLSWMANSWGWGHLNCQMPRGRDEGRGQMPRPWDRTSPVNTAAVSIYCTIVPLSAFKCVVFRFCRSASLSSPMVNKVKTSKQRYWLFRQHYMIVDSLFIVIYFVLNSLLVKISWHHKIVCCKVIRSEYFNNMQK